MAENPTTRRNDIEPLILDGLTVEAVAGFDDRISTPLGLSGVFDVHGWEMTDARDLHWTPFPVTLTPEMTAFDILRVAARTLHADGAQCEFSSMNIHPDERSILLFMDAINYDEQEGPSEGQGGSDADLTPTRGHRVH